VGLCATFEKAHGPGQGVKRVLVLDGGGHGIKALAKAARLKLASSA